jgi:predicted nucleic acid-binding protein
VNGDRLFLDTAFIQALLNRRDQHHARALELWPRVRSAREVWVTEAVLVEVGNALSSFHREGATRFIRLCYETRNIHVVGVDRGLLSRALELYEGRQDKTWGLTDCISFVVMSDQAGGAGGDVGRLAHLVPAAAQARRCAGRSRVRWRTWAKRPVGCAVPRSCASRRRRGSVGERIGIHERID